MGGLDPREELREAMGEFSPELRFLDCGWVLESPDDGATELEDSLEPADGITVDWVAVDPAGRLNLLIWMGSGDGGAESIELALEVLHRAQEQLGFILAHLGSCGVHPDLAPRLILAADQFSASTQRQLAVLGGERVRLIEVHEVRTDGGVSHHLVSRWPRSQESQAVGPVVFLDHLPDDLRAIGEMVLQGLDHVDDRVNFGGMGLEYLEWKFRDQALCSLEFRGGRLLASVAGQESDELTQMGASDAFIERVLRRYFEILEEAPAGDGEVGESLVDQGLSVVLSSEELDAFM